MLGYFVALTLEISYTETQECIYNIKSAHLYDIVLNNREVKTLTIKKKKKTQ